MLLCKRMVLAITAVILIHIPLTAQDVLHQAERDEVKSIRGDERMSLFPFAPSLFREYLDEKETSGLDLVLQAGLVRYRLEHHTQKQDRSRFFPSTESFPEGIIRSRNGSLIYPAIIYTEDPDAVRAAGIQVNAVMPGFVTARIQDHQLELLPKLDAVTSAVTGELLQPVMDQSLYETNAHLLHSAYLNETRYAGEGALVVVFDTGVDWEHHNFREPGDTTKSRILYLWDVTLEAEEGESHPGGELDYGVEYTRSDIEAALSDPSLIRSRDTNGHGTHVLGSAAGSGLYGGIAPDADIIVIRGGVNSFNLVDIINGLEYARLKGQQLGKPVVVNLSIGGRIGPRDGTRADEIAIDVLSENPGYIVVTSAGNDGSRNLHRSGSFFPTGSSTLTVNVPVYTPSSGTANDQFILDIWMDTTDSVTATVSSPLPNLNVFEAPHNTNETYEEDEDGTVYIFNNTIGTRRNIYIRVYDSTTESVPAQGDWSIELSGNGTTEGINYNAWLASFNVGSQTASLLNANNLYSVTMPATSSKAITVGAYTVNRNFINGTGSSLSYTAINGDIASFSSIGPTRDGRLKPDISAPGFVIRAALSQDQSISNLSSLVMYDGDHIIKNGTSMASPHVSGAIAVLLGANPSLTADEVKDILSRTAKKDEFTGAFPSNIWGSGKLDLLEAMRDMLNIHSDVAVERLKYHENLAPPESVVRQVNPDTLFSVRFRPSLSGDLTGVQIHTFDEISDEGFIYFEVYTDDNGIPGSQIGERAEVSMSEVNPVYYNYFDLSGTGINVNSQTEYHLVFGTGDGGHFNLVLDNGSGSHNRSKVFENGLWVNLTSDSGTLVREIAATVEITSGLLDGSAVPLPQDAELPGVAELKQNYPNPFNPVTNITYSVPTRSAVNLSVYDMLGRRVVQLVNGAKNQGTYTIQWDGSMSASGFYISRLEVDGQVFSRKMMLIK
jgi:subtilisin family serine protease